MAKSYEDKWQSLFNTLSEEAAAILIRYGEDRQVAQRGGNEFAGRVMRLFEKKNVYFPKYTVETAKNRNSAIRDEFKNGKESVRELAARHGISQVHAYNILKETQKETVPPRRTADAPAQCFTMELARMLIKHGVATADAVEAAPGLAAVFCAKWQGKSIYFPSKATCKTERDTQIWSLYQKGEAVMDIATRFGITHVSVSAIVRKMRAENGGEPAPQKKVRKALYGLQARVLRMAETYTKKNQEVGKLLQSAAVCLEKARLEVKR
ncbi:Mor transcription activator family protein [Geomonas propionica]|uniref:Mor transcription activator domain-containing protein n=1 Tax=Geomonas propionica TaxID=2798582 RepID=A0ABS0YRU5_9BACT|nr:Mor transcription activator family protein [Geomonas propionica]MBJ6800212.1 hypothetical protein [Geomonas propionica]